MCEVVKGETYGHKLEVWEQAKKEAIRTIVSEARRGSTISYSKLTRHIRSIDFDPHGYVFRHFLGEISTEEDAAGRGMLTVLVVHKDGDGMPGDGFFDLARKLGRDIKDRERCWSDEAKLVLAHCQEHPLAA